MKFKHRIYEHIFEYIPLSRDHGIKAMGINVISFVWVCECVVVFGRVRVWCARMC